MLSPGDVYWIYDAEPGIDHLHIVLTHPEMVDGELQVAVVNITSIRSKYHDRTTILAPGSHERIRRPSYVRYRDADFEKVDEVIGKRGYARAVEPLRTAMFHDIFAKICSSSTANESVKAYCSKRVGANRGQVLDLGGDQPI